MPSTASILQHTIPQGAGPDGRGQGGPAPTPTPVVPPHVSPEASPLAISIGLGRPLCERCGIPGHGVPQCVTDLGWLSQADE